MISDSSTIATSSVRVEMRLTVVVHVGPDVDTTNSTVPDRDPDAGDCFRLVESVPLTPHADPALLASAITSKLILRCPDHMARRIYQDLQAQ